MLLRDVFHIASNMYLYCNLSPAAAEDMFQTSNSHFQTSSSDITNCVTVDFVGLMAIAILATLKNSD